MLFRVFLFLVFSLQLFTGLAQTPGGAATATTPIVSDSLVRYYLSRAMTMQGLTELGSADQKAFAAWASTAGARFAGRVGGFWYTPDNSSQERIFFDTLRHAAATLHSAQPAIVVQGSIYEIVYSHVTNLAVPNVVRAEFGEDTVALPQRNFRFADMMYPGYFSPVDSNHYRWDDRVPGQAPGVPDMSRTETQIWFYCCARRLLDAGCEAIHFGQVMIMNQRDRGHKAWWSMLQRVRAYARTRNRGFVLCDAHTHGEYYDPDPVRPLPDSVRQLLFDFHSYPLRANETDTLRKGSHGARLDIATTNSPYGAIFGRSKGGVSPSGWPVHHLPALVELDNWGATPYVGQPGHWPSIWGFDEITWFATQPSVYRDEWLVYAAARVQQLDSASYLQMPGIRGVVAPPHPNRLYRADLDGQAGIIPAIWAGKTDELAKRLLLIGPVQP